jgi:hypothetical protein
MFQIGGDVGISLFQPSEPRLALLVRKNGVALPYLRGVYTVSASAGHSEKMLGCQYRSEVRREPGAVGLGVGAQAVEHTPDEPGLEVGTGCRRDASSSAAASDVGSVSASRDI